MNHTSDIMLSSVDQYLPQSDNLRSIVLIVSSTLAIYVFQRLPLLVEFGRYLRFISNHDGHYMNASKTLKGKVLAWVVPGRPITFYLSDSSAMKKVMGTLPTMDVKHLADLLHFYGWKIPMGEPAIHAADKQVHMSLTKAKIGPLIERFEPYFASNIQKSVELVGSGRMMPLQMWGYRLIYRSVTPTVFGDRFPIEETRIQNQHFAENVHWINISMMLPILPYWMWNAIIPGCRRACAARDQVKIHLEKWEMEGGVQYASDNYKSVAEVLAKGDFNSDIKAKWLNTVQFGFLANTGESVGWFLLYTTQSPKLLAKLREEVDALPAGDLSKIDIKKNCPYLDSSIQETFRLIGAVFAGRRVIKETRLPGIDRPLPKGSLVRTMTRAAVFDTEIWGEDAAMFRGDRFVGEEGSKLYREMMTFGSGASQCPGRFFAVHELQVVFATILRTFDFGTIEFRHKPTYESADGSFGGLTTGQTTQIIDLDRSQRTVQHPGWEREKGIEAISGLLQPAVEPVCEMKVRAA